RFWPAPLLFATMLLPRGVTAAPIDKQACVDAATRGQIQRDDQKLRAAAEAFEQCSASTCPTAVQKSCAECLQIVKSSMPVLTVEASPGATTRIDDVTTTEVTLDPGPHVVHVEAPGKVPFDQKIELAPKDKKTLTVHLEDWVRPTKKIRPIP